MVDNSDIDRFVSIHSELSLRYLGCYSADNFPFIHRNKFVIVNNQPSCFFGEHWLLIADSNGQLLFYDSFKRDLHEVFPSIFKRLQKLYKKNTSIKFVEMRPLFKQLATSKLCALYCLYVAHCIYLPTRTFPFYLTEEELLQFAAEKFSISTMKINSLKSCFFCKTCASYQKKIHFCNNRMELIRQTEKKT